MYSEGYRPEPEPKTFCEVLFMIIISCAGMSGLLLLTLQWATWFANN